MVPVRSDEPNGHSKHIIPPGLHGMHCNGGLCSVLPSQGHVHFPAWARGNKQKIWPQDLG